jgi:thiol-disulfide isomerase/thioredoxin
MSQIKTYLPWTARSVVSFLFLLSAVSKMFPIWMFEKQLVDLGITDWCTVPYFSRALIALELAIGFAILQKHWLKRFVIPVTSALLVAFCAHLTLEMIKHGPMNGNCGCFGQLIPMTPLEAFIKNIATLGLLVYIYKAVDEHPKGKNRFIIPLFIYTTGVAFMFVYFPFCPCEGESAGGQTSVVEEVISDSLTTTPILDTVQNVLTIDTTKTATETQIPEPEPAPTKSRFAEFSVIGGKKTNIDKGKKILCFFAPGCDHCQQAAKDLRALQKQGKMPEIFILFMDEEPEKIPTFLSESGLKVPYQILDIPKFWMSIGSGASTPGVYYLWNGNIMKSFEGTEANQFKPAELKEALEKPYSK